MRIYFDTEFTGLHKDTTLISIGLVDDFNRTFYAELTDYNRLQVDEWIESNVIAHLSKTSEELKQMADITIVGGKKEVALALREWLNEYKTVEWVSDVCHYDFVLLIDLVYSHALNIPYGIHGASCHDINQDIASFYRASDIEAFDMSREDLMLGFFQGVNGKKHNSIYDARVIRKLYRMLHNTDN
jgi:hypothetical protein